MSSRKVVLARDLQAYASADIDVRVLLSRLAALIPRLLHVRLAWPASSARRRSC